jgi:asparagine synthetase B (glutamine-hydrolysing)
LIDLCDYPVLRFGPASNAALLDQSLATGILPLGQYAFAERRGDSILLARDPIGCNKLFFGRDAEGRVVAANRIVQVTRAGVSLASVASCPPGHVIEIAGERVRKIAGRDISDLAPAAALDPAVFREGAQAILERGFTWLAEEFENHRFVVCLSGGLDSSVIASFAAAKLPGACAACFTYLDDDDLERYARGASIEELASASDDFRAGVRVAKSLGLPLQAVVRPRQAVASAIRESVHLCQDWRDFNVHCATVNLFLAQDIRAANPEMRVVVLTGDLMNEYVCDYREERVGDKLYYRIPRVALGRRRKYFVRGLDAGDREIGVFWAYRLVACQPFALLAEHYMRVPEGALDQSEVKWTLNGALLSPKAAPHVSRSKTRAQVGGKDQGTLGLYHRLGVGEDELRRIWRDQFPPSEAMLSDAIIEFGRYRAPNYAADG